MAKKMKSKTSTTKLSSMSSTPIVRKIETFPKPICLEYCQLDVNREFSLEVFKSLKAFSQASEFNTRNPHSVHRNNKLKHYKRYAGNNRLMSLDIKNTGLGRGNKRLLYFLDKELNVCKVLTLCTDKTH